MLDAQRLQVLAEVARAGSIASAARRLAFTPSAVSQQIGKLERDLGCEVLHRHPQPGLAGGACGFWGRARSR